MTGGVQHTEVSDPVLHEDPVPHEDCPMIDFTYLYRGLCGLSHSHRAGTMAGHLGAAVVAGYFFGEDQSDLPEAVYRGIEGELDRIIGGQEAFWYNQKKAGITIAELFEPFPQEPANAQLIPTIARALSANINATRQSGHNVIFASIAIRALHDHPDYAQPTLVAGIRKLTSAFNTAPPGRGYYGQEIGWKMGQDVELSADDDFAPYKDVADMAGVVIDELIASAGVRRQGFGGLWHLINHAAGISELERFGYKELALQALPAHHQHMRLWRSLPDVESELGALQKAEHDPREPEYWSGMLKRDEARLTHRIKTLYGFYTLRRYIQDSDTRTRAENALLYLMA